MGSVLFVAPGYSLLETSQLTRPRSDIPPAETPQFATHSLAAAGAVAIPGGALYLSQRDRRPALAAGAITGPLSEEG